MTISTTQNQISYTGDGSSTAFAFPYPFITTADLKVYLAGVLQSTGYSTAGTTPSSGSGTYASGTVTFVAAPAAAAAVLIYCDPDQLQSTVIPSNDPFPAKTVERMVDKLTLLVQRISGRLATALVFPLGETNSGILPVAAVRAGLLLSFDSLGNPQTVAPTSGSSAALATDLANSVSTAKGPGQIGFGAGLAYPAGSTGAELQAAAVQRRGRAAPHANFSWFTALWTVIGCPGFGRAAVLQDLRDLFLTQFSGLMTGGTVYVDGTNGNDGTGTGTINAPYATIDKAIRTINSGLVQVSPGTYTSAGFRYTDTQGTRPKMIVAPFGGVKITPGGDNLSTAVWAPHGTYPNTYQTTLAGANWVTRVLDSTTVDELGLPIPMPKQSSIVTVDSSGYGWWYDSATKNIYVRNGALNVNTVKARLSAIYSPGGDNSLLVLASILYLENITLDGYVYCLNQAGQATPQVWLKNCTVRYAESNSRNVQGGYVYSQACTYYRSAADHANYNILNSVTARGAEINDITWYAGDVDSFGYGATQTSNPVSAAQNKNGSSNHDSYVVRINGIHNKCYGPPIADTAPSYSWCLGTQTGYSYATAGAGQRIGFLMQGNSAWLDGCIGGPGQDFAFNSDSSANVQTFSCLGSQVASNSGVFAAYIPT